MWEPECLSRHLLFFAIWRGWYGPPVVEFRGAVIDGRCRLAVLGSDEGIPRVRAETLPEAVRLLVCAGHHDRALTLAGDALVLDETLPAVLRLPPDLVAPLLALHERHRRATKRKRPRKAPRRRSHVVTNLRRLVAYVRDGRAEGTAEELEEALGDWAP